MAREYFCCYHSYRAKLAKLSDQEVGRLFRALMEYSELGERPELAGRESVAFDFIADDIDRAKDKYADTCAKNRANASERQRTVNTASDRKRPQANACETVQNKDKDKDEYKPTNVGSPRATPPTMEEVQAYVREQRLRMDAEKFHAYYTMNGWKVKDEPMQDWRAACRYWAKNERTGALNKDTTTQSQGKPSYDLERAQRRTDTAVPEFQKRRK